MDLAYFLLVFHFIRPLWLLLVPIAFCVWLWIRRRASRPAVADAGIAPHLRDALTLHSVGRACLLPVDGVALVIVLAAMGAAGPTWSRQPDPFVAQVAPMAIVLKVTPSMTSQDVAPSRLERAKQKIRDLLALRAGAKTALVAYAGTAHTVVPMTDDPSVMLPYLQDLTPEIMPVEGADATQAARKAEELLSAEASPGAVLFVADGIDTGDLSTLNELAAEGPAFGALVMLPSGTEGNGFSRLDAYEVRVTPDDSDILSLDNRLNADYRRALNETGSQPWQDRGWLLAWPAAFLALIWFRRGWTMRWSAVFLLALGPLVAPQPARAGVADWFLTRDQQGFLAYREKDFDEAAELFTDPMWRGRALYRDGQYAEAAEVYARIPGPEAAFARGMAAIRNRSYREGVAAFERAVALDPGYPHAAENLAVAREILDYVETTRAQSDTGEEAGIGADDVVFDNEDARGEETRLDPQEQGEEMLTADQWMKFVDTRTGDFLRQRFAIEAAER